MTKKKASRPARAKTTAGSGKAARGAAAAAANPVTPSDVTDAPKPPKAAEASAPTAARAPFRRPQSLNFAGVGRNDICPCGSGKRFKNCHGH